MAVPSGMLVASSARAGMSWCWGVRWAGWHPQQRWDPALLAAGQVGAQAGTPSECWPARGDSSPFLTPRGEQGGSWENKEQQSMERQKDLPWLSEASESR